MQRNMFVVMRLCSQVVLSYLDAGFEPSCGRKDFWTACCLLLLLKCVAQSWTLKGGGGTIGEFPPPWCLGIRWVTQWWSRMAYGVFAYLAVC